MNAGDWQRELLDRLAARLPAGYETDGEPTSEPTALAGLALLAHRRADDARGAAQSLADLQSNNGSVGVAASRPTPCWPTSLAILLWQAVETTGNTGQFAEQIAQAVGWSIADHGKAAPRKPHIGHDTTLVGWSWAANTHSWLEPTALFVLALKVVGHSQHPRTREGVRLLVDRQLPSGGCNYGNTTVLGQTLFAHVAPTGVAMMALAGEGYDDPRTERSVAYLQRELSAETATASLCYGLLGLAAHDRAPAIREKWLQSAYSRVLRQGGSPYKLALVALAAANTYPFSTTR